ncbi:MAG: hypothetical protein HY606_15705, partial [Planctomycetes bacterium]|nr:hypothetical protein [Planctomycetota bacterium]
MNKNITRNIPRRGVFIQFPEKRGAAEKEDWLQYRIDALKDKAYTSVILLEPWKIREAYNTGLKEYRYIDKEWRNIHFGERWGRRNRTAFFRINFVIPESFRGQRVVADLMLGGESIVRINDVLSGGLDPNRTMLILADPAKGGEKIKIETETHVWSYPDDKRTGTQGDSHPISRSYLATLDTEIEGAYFDFAVPLEVMKAYKGKNPEIYNFLLFHLHTALNMINRCAEDVKIFKETLKKALSYLYKNIYQSDAFRKAGEIHTVGQAHLDIAFFWQKKDGIRKNLRTCLVQIDLLRRYPEFVFCQSQPALFEALKEYEPLVYKRVQKAVSAGQWEMIGGLYIECDCNLISGESFVRQFLYGKSFFQKEFNVNTRTCWLPDVFGNCGSMPQIMKKCGIDYFLTNKHSAWNDTNRLPHNIFWWQGIDGTRVLSFIPSVHFNGSMLPDHLLLNWDKFTDKETHPVSLYQFGWGDGGGGVTYEQLEFARRLRRFPGMPRVKIGKAENYFREVEKKSGDKLAVWKDDLYLETHRGTYTHKGMIKKLNRKSELMLRNAEIFSSISISYGNKYPKDKFRALWKKKLINDFHDILPGTHIELVTREAESDYRDCISIAKQEMVRSLNMISRHIDTSGEGVPLIVWNSLNWTRTDLARVEIKPAWRDFAIYDEDGRPLEYQVIEEEDSKLSILFVARDVPSIGYKVFYLRKGKPVFRDIPKVSKSKLENKFFCILLNSDGTFSS